MMDEEYIKLTQEWHRKGFESRQAEVDELQKRIDDALRKARWHIEDCECCHPMSNYQLGWFDSMILIEGILKGKEND